MSRRARGEHVRGLSGERGCSWGTTTVVDAEGNGGMDRSGREKGCYFFYFKKTDLGHQIIFDGPNLGDYRKGIFSLYIF